MPRWFLQIITFGGLAGVAAIMTFRKPPMRSLAYVTRIFLSLFWVWGILAVTASQYSRAVCGHLPDSQFWWSLAPGAFLVGFLLVALFVTCDAVLGIIERLKKPNTPSEGTR